MVRGPNPRTGTPLTLPTTAALVALLVGVAMMLAALAVGFFGPLGGMEDGVLAIALSTLGLLLVMVGLSSTPAEAAPGRRGPP